MPSPENVSADDDGDQEEEMEEDEEMEKYEDEEAEEKKMNSMKSANLRNQRNRRRTNLYLITYEFCLCVHLIINLKSILSSFSIQTKC